MGGHRAQTRPEPAQGRSDASYVGGVLTDSFAASVLVMLAASVVQRTIGLCRGLLFCRWLDPVELGQWDMTQNFVLLATALTVFSLPAAFGRYCEPFRLQGKYRLIVRQIGLAVALLASLATIIILVFREWFAHLVFGDSNSTNLIVLVSFTIAATVGYSFFTQLFTGMRLQRISARLQVVHSASFAVAGSTLILLYSHSALSVILGNLLSTLLVVALGFAYVWPIYHAEPECSASAAASVSLWAKIGPFALLVWLTDAFSNLFATVDRYMIIHHSGKPAESALNLVGQYHSAQLIALLFIQLSVFLATVALPHLVHDWESGNMVRVTARMNLMLKCTALLLLAGGCAALVAAPLAFDLLFAGKYSLGLSVLPVVLVCAFYFGLAYVGRAYLWCTERAHLVALSFMFGLIINVVLNYFWLPIYGLPGAIWATSTGALAIFLLTLALSRVHGLRVSYSTCLVCMAPMAIAFGWRAGSLTAALLGLMLVATNAVLTRSEKQALLDHLADAARTTSRFCRLFGGPRASAASRG